MGTSHWYVFVTQVAWIHFIHEIETVFQVDEIRLGARITNNNSQQQQ